MSNRNYPEDKMEPDAMLVGEQFRYTKTSNDLALRSIAISLKRIADTLDDVVRGDGTIQVRNRP